MSPRRPRFLARWLAGWLISQLVLPPSVCADALKVQQPEQSDVARTLRGGLEERGRSSKFNFAKEQAILQDSMKRVDALWRSTAFQKLARKAIRHYAEKIEALGGNGKQVLAAGQGWMKHRWLEDEPQRWLDGIPAQWALIQKAPVTGRQKRGRPLQFGPGFLYYHTLNNGDNIIRSRRLSVPHGRLGLTRARTP